MVKAAMQRLARGARLARLRSLISSFRGNKRGNVAVITALALLPMVAAMGCAVDYSMASMVKTKLQAAADAASLATVSINSSVITTAKSMTGNGTVSGGSTFATNFFNANLAQAPENNGYTASSLAPTATVTKTGTTITATVAFTAQVPTYFMGVMGYKNIAVSGTSSASYTLPTYIDFYLMLDVSGSMSFPSTTAEQSRLLAVNPDNLNGSMAIRAAAPSLAISPRRALAHRSSKESMARTDPGRGQTTNPRPAAIARDLPFRAWARRRHLLPPAPTIRPTATTSIGAIRRSRPAPLPERRLASNCAPTPSAMP